jgi:hypothetical protein
MGNKKATDKFTAIPNFVIEKYIAKIGTPAFTLYTILRKFASYETGECFPKIDTIAKLMGATRSSVHRNLKVLYSHGLLVNTSGRTGRSNRYFFPRDVAFMIPPCPKNATSDVAKTVPYIDPFDDTSLDRLTPSRSKQTSNKIDKIWEDLFD